VYQRVLELHSDGTLSETVHGDGTALLADGTRWVADPDSPFDPDGYTYSLVGDAWQDTPDGSVFYATTLARFPPKRLTDEQLDAVWLEQHPKASPSALQALRTQRAGDLELPTPPSQRLSAELLHWLTSAKQYDQVQVVAQLTDPPPLDVPRVSTSLFAEDPAFALDQLEQRLLAIELRKNDLESKRQPLIAELRRRGATVDYELWLLDAVHLTVDAPTLRWLSTHPQVLAVGVTPQGVPGGNDGREIRDATQIQPFLNAGYNGELGSGIGTVADIHVGVIDTPFLDRDHPVFNDCFGCSSRLAESYSWYGYLGGWIVDSGWPRDYNGNYDPNGGSAHGTMVASILLGDATQAQDSNLTTTTSRDAVTGASHESSFTFVNALLGPGMDADVEFMMTKLPDIINESMQISGTTCAQDTVWMHAVDAAVLQGAFFVAIPGNNVHAWSTTCDVADPAAAAGAFVVNASAVAGVSDLTAAPLGNGRTGGDACGRSVIDLVAPGNHDNPTIGTWNNTYANANLPYTSFAAPVVAGAAANLKHHLLATQGAAFANDVGNLYSQMLLMGDGQLTDGGKASASTPYDDRWGAGRLRMRMWTEAGMSQLAL